MTENVLGTYDGESWNWHHKRNISMAPSHMATVFVGLSLVSLIIASAFFWIGASLVLPFTLLEITVLFIAFVYYAVHATDYEKLTLSDSLVQIERKIGFATSQIQMVRSLTRLGNLSLTSELIELRQGQQSVYFGQFIHANLRPMLAKQIAARMQQTGFNT